MMFMLQQQHLLEMQMMRQDHRHDAERVSDRIKVLEQNNKVTTKLLRKILKNQRKKRKKKRRKRSTRKMGSDASSSSSSTSSSGSSSDNGDSSDSDGKRKNARGDKKTSAKKMVGDELEGEE